MNNKGFTDAPAKEDKFEIQNFINGVSKYVLTCNTPMTMSIQGDWGTGKTSMMQMIKNKITMEVSDVIWFDTWQFSQFNLGDKLPFILLKKLINQVSDNQNELKEKSISVVKNLFEVGTNVLTGGITNGKFVTEIFDNDLIEKIEKLKETFTKLVKKKTGDNGRIVIFIDDLDRLEPKKAVELLEILKIFLDCENCVFILAIDYNVVASGVKDKFGINFDEGKGKNFFDKIIQVAFKMPIANYNISEYVNKNLKDIDINVDNEIILNRYVSLVNKSIGNNPRAMKRLFNSFYLLSCVANKEILETADDTIMLFAILCMQSKYEKIYNYILQNKEDIDVDFIKNIKNPDSSEIKKLKLNEDEKDNLICFMQELYGLIDKNDDQDIGEEELLSFRKVLNFSGMTNATENFTISNDLWKYRELHRSIVRKMIDKLKVDTKVTFSEWKRKKYDVGNYWLYYSNWEDKEAIKKFGFQFCFIPLEKENKTRMDIEIYRQGDTNINDIVSIFGNNPLQDMNLKPENTENAICYKNVIIFNTPGDIGNVYEIVKKACEKLLLYFKLQ